MLEFPSEIKLTAIDCEWKLIFNFNAQRLKIKESGDALYVDLINKSWSDAVILIKRWLKTKARLELIPWLQIISKRSDLSFRNVTIRGQKTLWGSCSRLGDINLNYKLLFLPSDYVEYVLVHELCHTVHFDHSKNFWQLVACFVPEWKSLRRESRRANNLLPKWV